MQRRARAPLFPHRCGLALSLASGWWGAAAVAAAAIPPPFVSTLAPLPTDTTALVEGAPAVLVDPALAASALGAEAMVRRAGVAGTGGWGAGAVAGVLPVSGWHVGGGYERQSWFGRGPSRSSVIASFGNERLRAGVAVRRLRWHAGHAGHAALATDVSLVSAPWAWLRLAVGVDALTAPRVGDAPLRLSRLVRAGIALKPWRRDRTWALGLDVHVPVMRPQERVGGSLSVAVPVAPGWELLAGGRLGAQAQAYVGVRAHVSSVDAEWTGRAYDALGTSSVGQRLAGQARFVYRPSGPRWGESPPVVRFVLPEALATGHAGPFSARTLEVPLVVRLHDIARTQSHRRVVLDIDTLPVGLATIESLREAVRALRDAGIEVEARLVAADARTFALAATCSRVVMDATGELDLSGFASAKWFYGGGLGRYGLAVHAIAAGDHKTGADGVSRSAPRPEEANNRQPLVDAADGLLTSALVNDRRLSPSSAIAARREGGLSAERALAYHLIDAISPHVDVERGVVEPLPPLALAPAVRPSAAFAPPPTVAVVPIRGVMGADAWSFWTGESVDEEAVELALEQAAARSEVVGVIVAIDSPGGDVASSERLWRAVRRVTQHKPVVAALGDVAASGGYYVAVAAPRIVARRCSVTGSIGVYRLQPDLSGWLERMGILRDVRSAGPHADAASVAHPVSPEDDAMFTRSVDDAYAQFWARVRAARGLQDAARATVAGGRVWLGEVAKEQGLVDAIGDVSDAADWLAQQSGWPRQAVVVQIVPTQRASFRDVWRSPPSVRDVAHSLSSAWQRIARSKPMALYWPQGP